MRFDLFDPPPLDNTWRANRGTFNLDASAAAAVSALADAAEAFAEGGCLYRPAIAAERSSASRR